MRVGCWPSRTCSGLVRLYGSPLIVQSYFDMVPPRMTGRSRFGSGRPRLAAVTAVNILTVPTRLLSSLGLNCGSGGVPFPVVSKARATAFLPSADATRGNSPPGIPGGTGIPLVEEGLAEVEVPVVAPFVVVLVVVGVWVGVVVAEEVVVRDGGVVVEGAGSCMGGLLGSFRAS